MAERKNRRVSPVKSLGQFEGLDGPTTCYLSKTRVAFAYLRGRYDVEYLSFSHAEWNRLVEEIDAAKIVMELEEAQMAITPVKSL